MTKIFLSSDHHFYHANVIKYCNRPWQTVEEMNEGLIKNWNEVVGPEDTVFYLGDFSLSRKALHLVKNLKGNKILIPGNHDGCFPGHKKFEKEIPKYIEAGFSRVILKPFEYEGFLMWHLPYTGDTSEEVRYEKWRPVDRGMRLIHGHVHQVWKKRDRMLNVGVDVWDYKPVSFDVVMDMFDA